MSSGQVRLPRGGGSLSGRISFFFTRNRNWASLVVQRLRICLPVCGTRVQSLVQEDPVSVEQPGLCSEPGCHSSGGQALWSLRSAPGEAASARS